MLFRDTLKKEDKAGRHTLLDAGPSDRARVSSPSVTGHRYAL